MRKFVLAAVAALLWPAGTVADSCKVKDWKWSTPLPGALKIEGVATCESGQIILRLYEGKGGKFLGVDTAYIEGYAFRSLSTGIPKPSALHIKYVIKGR